MTDVVAALSYGGFVALVGLRIWATRFAAEGRVRLATDLLIAHVLVVSLTAGISGRDLWPFSAWRLMIWDAHAAVGEPPDPVSLRIVGVDSAGREHLVDYRAWQPLNVEELSAWLNRDFDELASEEKAAVGAFMLRAAEEARASALQGRRPGTFDRWLGSLSAPYHLLHPRRWGDVESVPEAPLKSLRFYREHYDLEAYRRTGQMRLEPVFAYPAGSE